MKRKERSYDWACRCRSNWWKLELWITERKQMQNKEWTNRNLTHKNISQHSIALNRVRPTTWQIKISKTKRCDKIDHSENWLLLTTHWTKINDKKKSKRASLCYNCQTIDNSSILTTALVCLSRIRIQLPCRNVNINLCPENCQNTTWMNHESQQKNSQHLDACHSGTKVISIFL